MIKYLIMRLFSPTNEFIGWYVNKNGGSIKLDNGSWIVNQSDEFHEFCYNEGYKIWKRNNTKERIKTFFK